MKRYYCVKQHDITDCGAACLATITKQYGRKRSIAAIREISGTGRMGTTAYGLIEAARHIGFNAKGVRGTIDQLMTEKIPLPAIAHVKKGNFLHFVVIHRIKKKTLLVADPAEGLVVYSKEDFDRLWTGVLILLIPDDSFRPADESRGIAGRFISLLVPHKKMIIEIFLASLLFTVLGILGAFYFKFLIDDILVIGLENTFHIISLGMVILTLFRVVLNGFRKHILLYLSQKIDISLIFSFYRHVLRLSLPFFDARKVGEILSRLNDASRIRATISSATLSVLIDTLMILVGGTVLFLQNRALFFVSLLFIPFSMLIVWVFLKPFRKVNRTQMREAADTEAYLVESLSGIATIKSLNAEEEAGFETERRFIRYLKAAFKGTWLSNLQYSLQEILMLTGSIVILWVGGIEVMRGVMSLGQLITYNALLAYFLTPVGNLINLQPALQEAGVAAERLTEILDIPPEESGEKSLIRCESFNGEVAISNLTFRYPAGEPVLTGISFSVKKGEKIAIVGESGSGKTTIAKLLLKYYLPEKGEITIDSYNIKDIHTENVREHIGYVPQDVFLFSGTIRENIEFGRKNERFELIVKAAQAARADEFIDRFPLRYDTLVGERGATLSGGQRQRIALARVILKNPDILILDEATSSLDSMTEKAIHDSITTLFKGKTMIIIAHRLSTISKSDRILLLDKGDIVESGNHMNLLRKRGKYYAMWKGQSDSDNYSEASMT
ncbi:MAG: peptidase domain-containing ABC transporter [Spirochaetales bacterium]|nr:peptidase domain-containing ABC transporter [Spirochaetales bacterium]